MRFTHAFRSTASAIAVVLSLSAFGQGRTPTFSLHSGDRVLFYGDSITDQRLYTTIAEVYVVTRYPTMPITFINSGWGGDKVSGGGGGDIALRLTRDVYPYRPTVMTVMLGMNDGGYKSPTTESDGAFFRGLEHIVTDVQQHLPAVRITLIEPSAYDNVTGPSSLPVTDGTLYNQVLIGYSRWIAGYAAEHHLGLADANAPLVEVLQKTNDADPAAAKEIVPGRIHPAFGGHLILAEALLKSWNARSTVAAITIDAAGGKARIGQSEHAKISQLTSSSDGMSWTELDDVLPLPLSQWQANWGNAASMRAVLEHSDIAKALNDEPLTVTGLRSGVYSLSIDGMEVGVWNDLELKAGIDLGRMKTPMSEQAFRVYELANEHVDLHWDRWRNVEVPLAKEGIEDQAVLSGMDALETSVVEKERAAAQPQPHSFVLKEIH